MESTRYEENGYVEWLNEKCDLHRTDGPAAEYASGDRFWYVNGKYHRTDGPAIEYANGYQEWWENGKLKYTYDPDEDE